MRDSCLGPKGVPSIEVPMYLDKGDAVPKVEVSIPKRPLYKYSKTSKCIY